MIPAHQLAAIRAAVNRGEGITQLSALQLLDEIDRLTFLWRNTRKQVAAQVEPHGFTVDSFLAADLAEIEDDRLRDLWLMVKGALLP